MQDNGKKRKKYLNHLSYVAHMAKADKGHDLKEKEFFAYLAEKFDVGPKTAKEIFENPDEVNLKKPQFHDERRQVLMDVLTVMVINKEISENELAVCRKFSEFLGFNSKSVEQTANGLLRYSKGEINQDEVQAIIDNL